MDNPNNNPEQAPQQPPASPPPPPVMPPPAPENNPYAPPTAESMNYQQFEQGGNSGHFGLLTEARKCEAGRGITWLTSAFGIFKDNFLLWIGMSLAFWVIFIILGMIPLVSLVINLIIFHFIAGFMLVCAEQEEGYQPEFMTMFSAFQSHFKELIILALMYFVLSIVAFIPAMITLFIALFGAIGAGAMSTENPDISALLGSGSLLMIMLGILISLAVFIPVFMSIYLAPPLIVLNNVQPLEAMKMSFKGCLRNMIPFLLLGLVMMVILPTVVIFTFGLGLLVVAPVMMITYYTCYRDIWTERMIGE